MTNHQFIMEELNHSYRAFYEQAVLQAFTANTQKHNADNERIAKWSIESAQELTRAMGYTNKKRISN